MSTPLLKLGAAFGFGTMFGAIMSRGARNFHCHRACYAGHHPCRDHHHHHHHGHNQEAHKKEVAVVAEGVLVPKFDDDIEAPLESIGLDIGIVLSKLGNLTSYHLFHMGLNKHVGTIQNMYDELVRCRK
ncbi:hypothetical protein PIB30_061480 [Stylosanthes scabra]|uniref:Uncharacterized protein n=1 Tax=Stylosanthes scabra TaxID=79078 RepID=A0ABU6YNE4_9FABA|nr:hypothetical protein [Stylosanthes scabra]